MRPSLTLAAGALVAHASAQTNYLGFNSGATLPDRSAKLKADFLAEFTAAQGLENAPGKFNAVRLYTNVQAYSEDEPIQAFEAAIETKTHILLGIWASGTESIEKDISALKKAVDQYGKDFTDLVIGISVGSEDLYRNSVVGIKNKAGIGAEPATLLRFIGEFKKAFADTPLASIPFGHVDTWDVWTNASNKAVLDAVDWVGVDAYPYYEEGKGNNIKNSGTLFDKAYDAVIAAVGDKPVWVTETGWPATGPNWGEGVPSVENAKYYWNEVGCRRLFGQTPTFWYTLRDSNPDNEMKFAITNNLSTKPLFDLTCPTTFDTPGGASSSTSPLSPTGGGSTKSSNRPEAQSQTSGGSMGPGAIAGIAIGSLAAVAVFGALAFLLIRRRKKSGGFHGKEGTGPISSPIYHELGS